MSLRLRVLRIAAAQKLTITMKKMLRSIAMGLVGRVAGLLVKVVVKVVVVSIVAVECCWKKLRR